jgi:heme/copper-type cytochrome/quinol oxidase subunit 4
LYFLYVERDSSQITPEKPLGFLLLVAIPVVTGAVWVIDLIRGWLKSTMSK